MLNIQIYFRHKYKTHKKVNKKRLNLIEKIIIYSLPNIKTIKSVILKKY